MDNFKALMGMTPEEATVYLNGLGSAIKTIRVTSADGKYFVCTCDYRTDRLNVGLTGDRITSITGVG